MNILLIRDMSSHIRTIPLNEPLQIDMTATDEQFSYMIRIKSAESILAVKLNWIGEAQAQSLFDYIYNKIKEALLTSMSELSLIEIRAIFLTDKDSSVEVFEGHEATEEYAKVKKAKKG